MNKLQKTVICFGFGDSARAVGNLLAGAGWQVIATSRSEDGVRAIREQGFQAVLFGDGLADQLPAGAHWLISTPPDADGCPTFGLR